MGPLSGHTKPRLFGWESWREVRRIGDILRTETVGGMLLVAAAVVALVWANSRWGDAYSALSDLPVGSDLRVGPLVLHLKLELAEWASSGLLMIFFFVAGLELKREFVAGDLRDPRQAALPVAATVGGMIVPALIYVGFNARSGHGALLGWAIPTPTDIAFALALLAIISTHLPAALRLFLLTLAVLDDLLGITIIALFYRSSLHLPNPSSPQLLPLVLALLPLGLFAVLVQRRVRSWWLLLPLAAATWVLVHESGIHPTVTGVLLGFTVPVIHRTEGPGHGLAEHFEHRWRPISAGVAVPVFAFFAAGVTVGNGLGASLTNSVTLGIATGLVVGKTIGVLGTTWLIQRFTHARLAEGLSWWDMLGLALLTGMGFTVALLIGELAFPPSSEHHTHAKIGVLLGSLLSALLATIVLRIRNHHYRQLCAEEEHDTNGVPEAHKTAAPPPAGGVAVVDPSDTAALSSGETTTGPVQITLPSTIYLSDESAHEQVEVAIEDLLMATGGHIEYRDDPVLGSWFQRMRAKVGKFVSSAQSTDSVDGTWASATALRSPNGSPALPGIVSNDGQPSTPVDIANQQNFPETSTEASSS